LKAKISPAASVLLKEHPQEMNAAGAQLHSEDSATDAQWRHGMSNFCFDGNSVLEKAQNGGDNRGTRGIICDIGSGLIS
jgi:hypothetical protein